MNIARIWKVKLVLRLRGVCDLYTSFCICVRMCVCVYVMVESYSFKITIVIFLKIMYKIQYNRCVTQSK